MTARQYDCRRDADGWTIFDRWTGQVVVLQNVKQAGLSWAEADRLTRELNERRHDGDRGILQ